MVAKPTGTMSRWKVRSDICIPAEMELMIEGLIKYGMCHADAEAIVKSRKAEFKKALSKYMKKKKKRVGYNKA